VAILVPFWEFWEQSARIDVRQRLREVAAEAGEALAGAEVVAREVLFSAEEAAAVAGRLGAAEPEAILVVQVMAVPPARTMAVLDALAELPLVLWAMHQRDVGSGFDHSDITIEGATVGSSQLANLLGRGERHFEVVVGRHADPATLAAVGEALAAAAAARRLATATLARVGEPPPGYDCVVCDFAELRERVGIEVVDFPASRLAELFAAAAREPGAEIAAEVAADFELAPGLDTADEGLRRSLRFAAALERFDRAHAVNAGAVNCHVPELRFSPEVGIAPCFALGRETSRGVPWTCAGDVLTALAMLLVKQLGGATLYHELETIDYETDELIIANTGEHDLGWAAPGRRPDLRPNGWFEGDLVCGVCACFSPPPGAATLVAFTPHAAEPSGFRFVVAEGEFSARSLAGAGTPNGAFSFLRSSAPEGFREWLRAGSNHHSCATPGHFGDRIEAVAGYLGVGLVRIA